MYSYRGFGTCRKLCIHQHGTTENASIIPKLPLGCFFVVDPSLLPRPMGNGSSVSISICISIYFALAVNNFSCWEVNCLASFVFLFRRNDYSEECYQHEPSHFAVNLIIILITAASEHARLCCVLGTVQSLFVDNFTECLCSYILKDTASSILQMRKPRPRAGPWLAWVCSAGSEVLIWPWAVCFYRPFPHYTRMLPHKKTHVYWICIWHVLKVESQTVTCVISLNPHSGPLVLFLWSPFCREDRGGEGWCCCAKATHSWLSDGLFQSWIWVTAKSAHP